MDEGSWVCLHEPSHGFEMVTSLLYAGRMLYVAGIPGASSSWEQTWRDGYGLQKGGDGSSGVWKGGGLDTLNATQYTIARMSLSPAKFNGKYETWGVGDGDGDKAVSVGFVVVWRRSDYWQGGF